MDGGLAEAVTKALSLPRGPKEVLPRNFWLGNSTKQGSRPSCPDQEGRKGSEEGVPENLRVPLEGDRDFGELCGSHQGCQGDSGWVLQ